MSVLLGQTLQCQSTYMLECTTAIPKVTVVETRTVLWFTEDNPHGAAVVTFVTRFARG